MPFTRPDAPPSDVEIVAQFENAIRGLITRFRAHPYAFYTESDLHCYLYHLLYRGGLINGLYRTAEGQDTILLHKEYPTATRYSREPDKTLKPSPQGRRRGAFDICIWDPHYIGTLAHRKQKVLCAAELALNECGKNSVHTINDATKLTGTENEVRYGYLLFFVRDDSRFRENENGIVAQLKGAATRARVALVHVEGDKKHKPVFLGAWGTVVLDAEAPLDADR